MKKVYFAGGWFTPEMEEEHTRLYNLIKDNYAVFNPKLESKIGQKNGNVETFLGNINAIEDADIVLVITDRKDMGTIWEAGVAYQSKKPIIYYAETLGDRPFNLMLAMTGKVAKNENELLILLNQDLKFEKVNNFEGKVE